ncbi:hypothetical protein M409DRAFT_70704 [Zasmidium cellare ATCC 36951]|uniref:Intradiol ring-cleavage dioxygenases domain-containing protein n=1 Tax=Zasmidium cellare ATCC 36951 TaxID=1080233 RepID=A0A6A6BYT5_ZASCE|nr:uncharacterized protein M409DRAFT_70704 [Zasmidium cellare ATCC 36951]KAF2159957.1 hypothetical protein M409DRAFT_70704 [Zasmidium cellare ATCC 36951]
MSEYSVPQESARVLRDKILGHPCHKDLPIAAQKYVDFVKFSGQDAQLFLMSAVIIEGVADPRLREVISNLVRHLHAFCRESRVTRPEFQAALKVLARAGQMTDDTRDEVLLLTDVLGSEALIDDITRVVERDTATVTAHMGDSIVHGFDEAAHAYLHGSIVDSETGKPISGAELDVWEAAPNGLYEQQDPDQPDMSLRGIFRTGEDGKYSLYCLRPTTYPIPDDGPAGDLLKLLDRHPMRAAHIHFMLKAPGYKTLVTELFDREDKYVNNDSMFAVKPSLIVDFVPRADDPKAQYTAQFTFRANES